MTSGDIDYLDLCFRLGLIRAPFMEVGAAKVQAGAMPNLCDLVRDRGLSPTLGTDIQEAPGVDMICNFGLSSQDFGGKWTGGQFGTVAVFNVLEHTFNPLLVLENAASCLAPGGTLLVVAPAVWPIHSHPFDMVRLLPSWYEEFARVTELKLDRRAFQWISQFGLRAVDELQRNGERQLPNFLNSGRDIDGWRYWTSRAVHKVFRTYGRSHVFTHASIGAAFCKPTC